MNSFGGTSAAVIASNPSNGYNITHVFAAGSPIANMPIPSHVKVTEFVQNQDIVPTLGGASNPTASNWQTVYVNAPVLSSDKGGPITPLGKNPAHNAIRYAVVAQHSDADNAVSLPAGATASVTDYYAVR